MCDKAFILALQRANQNDLSGMTVADRRDALGLIAGTIQGMLAPLPSTPVSPPTNYYTSTLEPTIVKEFEKANEIIFLNTEKAIEVARNIYYMRYRMVFDIEYVLGNLPELVIFDMTILPKTITDIFNRLPEGSLRNISKFYF